MRPRHGWTAIGTVVAIYDVWALRTDNPTLSKSYRVALDEHPFAVLGFTAYLVAHLSQCPRAMRHADPFNVLARGIRAI